ncbi:hypothetical protein [Pedosphaera parvula]|nr:hypothetical protein [Pedosphaera parvula]
MNDNTIPKAVFQQIIATAVRKNGGDSAAERWAFAWTLNLASTDLRHQRLESMARTYLLRVCDTPPAAPLPNTEDPLQIRAYELATRAARDIQWTIAPGRFPAQIQISAPVYSEKAGGIETRSLTLTKDELVLERTFLVRIFPLLATAIRREIKEIEPDLRWS